MINLEPYYGDSVKLGRFTILEAWKKAKKGETIKSLYLIELVSERQNKYSYIGFKKDTPYFSDKLVQLINYFSDKEMLDFYLTTNTWQIGD